MTPSGSPVNDTDHPSLLRAVLAFARSLRQTVPGLTALALAVSVASAAVEGVSTLLLTPLLLAVGVDMAGSAGRIASGVTSLAQAAGLGGSLGALLAVYVASVAMLALLKRWQSVLALTVEHQYVAATRARLFDAVVHASWRFERTQRRADLAYALLHQADRAGAMTFHALFGTAGALAAIAYVAIAVAVSPLMTAGTLVVGALVIWLQRHVAHGARGHGERLLDESRQLYANLTDRVQALRLVKMLGLEARESHAVAVQAQAVAAGHVAAARLHSGARAGQEIGAAVALAVMLYTGLRWLHLDAAGTVLLLYVFSRTVPRLAAVQQAFEHMAYDTPAFEQLEQLRQAAEAAREPAPEAELQVPLTRAVTFDRVSFTYPGATTPALEDLSFSIPKGRLTAIVGASGAGKSTLADVLCGLLQPTTGAALLDGEPLSPATWGRWRRSVGYLQQDAVLFDDTVRANLLWARPGATGSELQAALELASATFVFDLPQGLDTPIGDRGGRLSGGERQRLALARALLRQPSVLVLDEPTSALDAENEARVLDAVKQLAGRVTTVLVTHRLAAVRGADHIIVLDEGRLVEAGDWSTLGARTGGRLRALCEMQGIALGAGEPFMARVP